MKKVSDITSVETKSGFKEKMIEKFVKNNLPQRTLKEGKTANMGIFAKRYKEIECCAAELPVSGAVEIIYIANKYGSVKRFNYPVISRFVVFCTRQDNLDYKVTWSCSLS